jgi:Predicted phosphatases
MCYKAVLFDLDGTLLDTLEDLATAANTPFWPPAPCRSIQCRPIATLSAMGSRPWQSGSFPEALRSPAMIAETVEGFSAGIRRQLA